MKKSTAKVDESQKNLHGKDEEKQQENDANKDDNKNQLEHHVVANLDQ